MGALAGLGDFNLFSLIAVAGSASVCGDSCGYLIGRQVGRRIIAWLSVKRRFISPQILERSQEYFQRRGAWAILLSRCVVPALGGTINILAGAERYPFRRFLLYDISGEIAGAALPLILGYIFGVSWEAASTLLTTISLLVVALLVVIYLICSLVRMLRRMHTTRQVKNIAKEAIAKTKLEYVLSSAEVQYSKQEDGIERRK